MSHEQHDWATARIDAAIRKACAESPYYLYTDVSSRQALALELRKVAAECAAIVEQTLIELSGRGSYAGGQATLLSAAARIRAAFPDREGTS